MRTTATRVRWSVIIGVVVTALVAGGGVFYVQHKQTTYDATATILVLPVKSLNADTAISLFESLGDTEVVPTFAQILNSGGATRVAAKNLKLSASDANALTTKVHVVAGTSLIDIVIQAPESSVAVNVADNIARSAITFDPELAHLYTAQVASSAQGSALRHGASKSTLIAAVVLVALILGIALQQALMQAALYARRASDRHSPPAVSGDDDPYDERSPRYADLIDPLPERDSPQTKKQTDSLRQETLA